MSYVITSEHPLIRNGKGAIECIKCSKSVHIHISPKGKIEGICSYCAFSFPIVVEVLDK